jgi:hypothetical protein
LLFPEQRQGLSTHHADFAIAHSGIEEYLGRDIS